MSHDRIERATPPEAMPPKASRSELQVVREYGPFDDAPTFGVVHDGTHVWVATGEKLRAVDPDQGNEVRTLPVTSDAGTAFDGQHIYQITAGEIHKIDAKTGELLATIPAPGGGRDSGLTWAEGSLWVGQHRDRKIHRIDPETGRILKTLTSDRFVTGVSWSRNELWHGTWEGESSELRQLDPETGEVLQCFHSPPGMTIAGLSCVDDLFYCGSGPQGRVRVFQRPLGDKSVPVDR